ncbi:hypothetical protein MKX01_042066 [Papaver californicum]|nr:hypothetical protein MKX01_042066 [Papaver californicum]
MATVPVRSHHQPLHNFPLLKYPKWGKNHQINTPNSNTNFFRNSEEHEGFSPEFVDHNNSMEESSGKNQLNLPYTPSPSPPTSMEKEKPVKCKNSISENEIKSLKLDYGGIKNRIPGFDEGVAEVGDSSGKPWNLRPRRAVSKAAATTHDEINGVKNSDFHEKLPVENHHQQPPPKSLRLRGFADNVNVDNRGEKRKLWISLSREEIEEDFFILTGSKPPRRPKKRTKNVQKVIDNALPGMWLAGITADSYSIPEGPPKR